MKRAIAVLLASSLWACSTPPPRPVADAGLRDHLGKVAIVASGQPGACDLASALGGAGQEAVTEGGKAFADCMGSVLQGCGGAGMASFACVGIGLAICGAAGAASGASAAAEAPDAASREGAARALSDALQPQRVQEALRGRVESIARGYGVEVIAASAGTPAGAPPDVRALAEVGVDRIVEITLIGASMQSAQGGGMFEHAVYPSVVARTRVIDVRDGRELLSATLDAQAGPSKPGNWLNNAGKPLIDSIGELVDALGERLAEYVFALHPFPDPAPHRLEIARAGDGYGLLPIHPVAGAGPARGVLGAILGPSAAEQTVESLQPRFKWQAFPRESDLSAAPEPMGRVSDVRYDLRIFREGDDEAPFYRRDGVRETDYLLETPLLRGTWFRWTVRARFKLDGRVRLTPWAQRAVWTFPETVPSAVGAYPFKTP